MNQLQNYQQSSGENMKGRTVLLKLYSAINFYDQSLKKIVNENVHMMTYMQRAAERKQEEDKTNDVTD
jgi:hypothetical protein